MENNFISHHAVVHAGVKMGNNNVISHGAIIYPGVTMGDWNYIGPYAIVGGPPEKKDFFDKIGKCLIGSRCRIEKQVTIDSGTEHPTTIGDDVILLKNAHVGHDAILENGVILSCNVCIGGHTIVREKTNFGLGAVAHQRLDIPAGCMIGMNSTITKKTYMAPNCKYIGSPAKYIGFNNRK